MLLCNFFEIKQVDDVGQGRGCILVGERCVGPQVREFGQCTRVDTSEASRRWQGLSQ